MRPYMRPCSQPLSLAGRAAGGGAGRRRRSRARGRGESRATPDPRTSRPVPLATCPIDAPSRRAPSATAPCDAPPPAAAPPPTPGPRDRLVRAATPGVAFPHPPRVGLFLRRSPDRSPPYGPIATPDRHARSPRPLRDRRIPVDDRRGPAPRRPGPVLETGIRTPPHRRSTAAFQRSIVGIRAERGPAAGLEGSTRKMEVARG